jgi:hypothetical protein
MDYNDTKAPEISVLFEPKPIPINYCSICTYVGGIRRALEIDNSIGGRFFHAGLATSGHQTDVQLLRRNAKPKSTPSKK